MLVNTQYFKESGLYFQKHGRYNDGGIDGTHQYYQFWDEEKRRFEEGYTIGGLWIPGQYYFYLNYCPIEVAEALENTKGKSGNIGASRSTKFPLFWDLDYHYFMALNIAKYGIDIESYNKLPFDLGLSLEEDNLTGGKHFLYLAARAAGKSYKAASLAAFRYYNLAKSATFMVASDSQYLKGDGIFTKFWNYKNFINTHTPFVQYSDVKNDFNSMHVRASYKDLNGIEKGKLSEIIGITVGDGRFDKLRGKRGSFLIEEVGSIKEGDKLWEILRPAVQQGNLVYDQIIGFGTGGDGSGGADFLEKAFFNPEPFGILKFKNLWDEGLFDTDCSFFRPALYNIAFVDTVGNTDLIKSKIHFDKERLSRGKSNDPMDLVRAKSENPYTPSEALLRADKNIFPKAELLAWKTELLATGKILNLSTYGDLEDTKEGVKFRPSITSIPVNKYPHDKRLDNSGCVTVWEAPFRYEGLVPDNLYIICVDPYMHDSTTGDSLGSIYVIKNINAFSKPDDVIVASYVGRPASMDLFHKKVRQLAEYYNAKIGFENNAGQALLAYFKGHKKLNLLAPEFELGFNENIPKSGVRRGFGMHIDQRRKEIGLAYLADWLVKQWTITEDGEILYNYHKIYDVGLLEEFIKFTPDKNYDRISALIIGMYFIKEIDYKYKNINMKQKEMNRFFTQTLFQ